MPVSMKNMLTTSLLSAAIVASPFVLIGRRAMAETRMVLVGGGVAPEQAIQTFVAWASDRELTSVVGAGRSTPVISSPPEPPKIVIITWGTEEPKEGFEGLRSAHGQVLGNGRPDFRNLPICLCGHCLMEKRKFQKT